MNFARSSEDDSPQPGAAEQAAAPPATAEAAEGSEEAATEPAEASLEAAADIEDPPTGPWESTSSPDARQTFTEPQQAEPTPSPEPTTTQPQSTRPQTHQAIRVAVGPADEASTLRVTPLGAEQALPEGCWEALLVALDPNREPYPNP